MFPKKNSCDLQALATNWERARKAKTELMLLQLALHKQRQTAASNLLRALQNQIISPVSGQDLSCPLRCSWLQDDTCRSHPELHPHRGWTKPSHPVPVQLIAVWPACATPLSDGVRVWPLDTCQPQTQKTPGRSNTRHPELYCQNHKDPSAMMGSIRLMKTTPFHLEFLCIRVTLISKFTWQ